MNFDKLFTWVTAVAIGFAALATFLSGVVVAIRMTETIEKKKGVS